MTINDVIKKAVEGGWKIPAREVKWIWYMPFKDAVNPKARIADDSLFLDPSFWRSLGKAMGLDDAYKGRCSVTGEWEELNPVFLADCLPHRESTIKWHTLSHRFIDSPPGRKNSQIFLRVSLVEAAESAPTPSDTRNTQAEL